MWNLIAMFFCGAAFMFAVCMLLFVIPSLDKNDCFPTDEEMEKMYQYYMAEYFGKDGD